MEKKIISEQQTHDKLTCVCRHDTFILTAFKLVCTKCNKQYSLKDIKKLQTKYLKIKDIEEKYKL